MGDLGHGLPGLATCRPRKAFSQHSEGRQPCAYGWASSPHSVLGPLGLGPGTGPQDDEMG